MQARMRLILEIHSYEVADNQYIAAYYLIHSKKQFAKHSSEKNNNNNKTSTETLKIEISQYIPMLTTATSMLEGKKREISSTMLQKLLKTNSLWC